MLNGANTFTLLKSAQQFLEEKKLPDYKSDAEVLLSFVLKIKRSRLALIRDKKPASRQIEVFESFVLRRSKREPCAYITGFSGFMGLEFKVDQNVLIPRPETELLVETTLKLSEKENKKSVLDLCCGSGCIAVSLSKLGNFENITAVDISANALEIAKKNAVLNSAYNIEFIESYLFNKIDGRSFDFIISNPPYISYEEYINLEAELKYEPKIALLAKNKGLFFYKEIAGKAKFHLNKCGFILIELNANKEYEIKRIFNDCGYNDIEIIKDYAGLPRILKAGV
jgi:release factor glutamine methyltransferase